MLSHQWNPMTSCHRTRSPGSWVAPPWTGQRTRPADGCRPGWRSVRIPDPGAPAVSRASAGTSRPEVHTASRSCGTFGRASARTDRRIPPLSVTRGIQFAAVPIDRLLNCVFTSLFFSWGENPQTQSGVENKKSEISGSMCVGGGGITRVFWTAGCLRGY